MTHTQRKAMGHVQVNTDIPSMLRHQVMAMFRANGVSFRQWLTRELQALVDDHEAQKQCSDQTPASE